MWSSIEDLYKQSKDVDKQDFVSLNAAIADLEIGLNRTDVRSRELANELERLRIILKPSTDDYIEQLEKSLVETLRIAAERVHELRIRKLILKKYCKVSAYQFFSMHFYSISSI